MKADNLRRMRDQGLPVPPFTVVTEDTPLRLDFSEAERFAVRSTFDQEDSAQHSFAGQFETLLNVPRSDVPDAIRRVRESYAAGYAAYARAHGLPEAAPVQDAPVLVQEMVDADMAGVLFTANPTGQLNEIVSVVGAGLGNALGVERSFNRGAHQRFRARVAETGAAAGTFEEMAHAFFLPVGFFAAGFLGAGFFSACSGACAARS
jgi:pyruvate,water dikinase